jgi:hypothetical protein
MVMKPDPHIKLHALQHDLHKAFVHKSGPALKELTSALIKGI